MAATTLAVLVAVFAGVFPRFAHYSQAPDELPEEWRHGLDRADAGARARHIADFIAGMTDRYAQMEHARLFDSTPELR